MQKISFLIFFIYSTFAFSANPIAEVIKVRGDVSQLAPGAMAAKSIAIGDKLSEDTSVLTGPSSFIKIKFLDNSEVNLGPESKIVISEMKKNEPGVISLLKGKIRTEVEKSNNTNTNKFFIKTRTAAMGVRGTDFQTIYNPENKVTSLLTYKGEVAMSKINDEQYRKIENGTSQIKVERNAVDNTVETVKSNELTNESTELNKILAEKNTVLVPPGQNSIASDALKKATLPVKISPAQLNVLYKNADFNEKDDKNLKKIDEKELKLELKSANQKAPLEGYKNEATGDFAPKAGGYIDMKTGLYVAPLPDSKFDPKLGVYVSESVGNVDKDTGAYIAPAGYKLDATKGFILDGNKDDPKLVAFKDDLNKNAIARDSVVLTEVSAEHLYNINEKYIRDEISIELLTGTQKVKFDGVQSNTYSADKDNFHLGVEWKIASLERMRSLLGAEIANINYKKSIPQNFTLESRKLFNVYFGGMYAINRYFDLFSKVGLYQDQYFNLASSSNSIVRIVTTKLTLGVHSQFFEDSKFPVDLDLWGMTNFTKRLNNLKVKNGSGIGLQALVNYKLNDRRKLGVGLFSDQISNKVVGDSFSNDSTRTNSGLKIKFDYIF